jgi:hypothetical protein
MKTIWLKKDAYTLTGGLTQTSKMPCKSYSLPTEACKTGFKMAQIKGSVCASCYADKGFYSMYQNTIKPAQFARLDSINNPNWVDAMVVLIGSDQYFRWHDSGDLQGLEHFEKIVQVAKLTPKTRHWLPTREYSIIKSYIAKGEKIPENLIVRLSGMYPDKPVQVPASLQGVKGITTSNVHTSKPLGLACKAPSQAGECRDCRACWTDKPVSYLMH